MAKIFIVEDDVNLANTYKQALVGADHQVSIVPDDKAVAQIKAEKPNLIILDIVMPRVNGLDILREVKADAAISEIPVILLTNMTDGDSITRGLEYGAYGYLLKAETGPNQMISRVNMTLEETMPQGN